MKAELTKLCKRLRLSQNLVENALDIEAPTHPEYLAEVLRRELTHRETMRRNRLLKQAGFPSLKLFRDFVFDEVKLPVPLTVEELKNTRFLDDRRNLIFYGNVGTGKTHLATALGIAACQAGKQVRFFRTASLVNQLVQARKAGQLDKLLKQFGKLDLLICDEWGYVPLDRDGAQLLFHVVADCYETRSLIITTNLEFVKWVNVFYDEKMTAAMIDRLVHHSHLVIFDGPSYRVRHSLMASG